MIVHFFKRKWKEFADFKRILRLKTVKFPFCGDFGNE